MEFLIASIASVARQHAGDGEETDLHDGVDAPAHAAVARHLGRVDDKELRTLVRSVCAARSRADVSQTSSGPNGELSRNVPPGARSFSTS